MQRERFVAVTNLQSWRRDGVEKQSPTPGAAWTYNSLFFGWCLARAPWLVEFKTPDDKSKHCEEAVTCCGIRAQWPAEMHALHATCLVFFVFLHIFTIKPKKKWVSFFNTSSKSCSLPQKDADCQTSRQFAASASEKNLLRGKWNKLLVKFTKRCRIVLHVRCRLCLTWTLWTVKMRQPITHRIPFFVESIVIIVDKRQRQVSKRHSRWLIMK